MTIKDTENETEKEAEREIEIETHRQEDEEVRRGRDAEEVEKNTAKGRENRIGEETNEGLEREGEGKV